MASPDRPIFGWLVAAVLAGILLTVLRLAEQDRGEVAKLRQKIESLGSSQETMRNEFAAASHRQFVAEASTTLQRDVVLDTGGAPFRGSVNAPVTLIEYTDFASADCARYARETLPQLERDYIASGKLKYVLRSFPDEPSHAFAFRAHEAAYCAGEQGKFWQMHDRLFAPQAKTTAADMPANARTIGLDRDRFLTCFDGGLEAPAIRRDILDAQKNGVTSTPTFFVGPTDPAAPKLRATRIFKGAPPYAQLKEVIDALLNAG